MNVDVGRIHLIRGNVIEKHHGADISLNDLQFISSLDFDISLRKRGHDRKT